MLNIKYKYIRYITKHRRLTDFNRDEAVSETAQKLNCNCWLITIYVITQNIFVALRVSTFIGH
jgi:hypothetical protein